MSTTFFIKCCATINMRDFFPIKSRKLHRDLWNFVYARHFLHFKVAKEGSKFICLSVILIDYVFRTGKSYYSQVFLEDCKYVVKEKRCLSILLTT